MVWLASYNHPVEKKNCPQGLDVNFGHIGHLQNLTRELDLHKMVVWVMVVEKRERHIIAESGEEAVMVGVGYPKLGCWLRTLP